MANARKAIGKGLAVATLVTAAVALAQALKKNKKAKMLKASAEEAKANVVAHAKKLGGVSRKSYERIVDAVMAEYRDMRMLSAKELSALGEELKSGWEDAKKKMKKPAAKKR